MFALRDVIACVPTSNRHLQALWKSNANDVYNLHLLTNFATAGYNNTCFFEEDFQAVFQ
jgi:hypothetical protein